MTFNELWNNYNKLWDPTTRKILRIGDKCAPYPNQCAIRMSRVINETDGELLNNFVGENVCVSAGEMHVRGAQSLADHIEKDRGVPEIYEDGAKAREAMKGRTGIVFFDKVNANGTDHIDLWNGVNTQTGEYFNSNKIKFFPID